ncbi:hypothetical protein BU26DRAFT_596086 [Trematosphaeria pertusa]|uniref:Uncharacterized protein n=1 Tax=Trematosphaeria pertusa TaxID=390896 RepID=A0A6A6IDA7_9PLEO|nr:uncharacterized protein BU26DRAFT_596086 [Trematosphaeria pertusa]KAF2248187.1 hypothetical protein BU26DRAFT_596086 [Trematosphaeria pertusa]
MESDVKRMASDLALYIIYDVATKLERVAGVVSRTITKIKTRDNLSARTEGTPFQQYEATTAMMIAAWDLAEDCLTMLAPGKNTLDELREEFEFDIKNSKTSKKAYLQTPPTERHAYLQKRWSVAFQQDQIRALIGYSSVAIVGTHASSCRTDVVMLVTFAFGYPSPPVFLLYRSLRSTCKSLSPTGILYISPRPPEFSAFFLVELTPATPPPLGPPINLVASHRPHPAPPICSHKDRKQPASYLKIWPIFPRDAFEHATWRMHFAKTLQGDDAWIVYYAVRQQGKPAKVRPNIYKSPAGSTNADKVNQDQIDPNSLCDGGSGWKPTATASVPRIQYLWEKHYVTPLRMDDYRNGPFDPSKVTSIVPKDGKDPKESQATEGNGMGRKRKAEAAEEEKPTKKSPIHRMKELMALNKFDSGKGISDTSRRPRKELRPRAGPCS